MKWGVLLGSLLLVLAMILYQWPKLNQKPKRDKLAFLTLSILGGILAIVLIFFPSIANPTQAVNWLYEPLGKILKK
ncbi:hypothetical protein IEC97_28080 [Neobacillus cucumis]|uniref:hypothetical protein n=1 Tax=Neobacillus cucumis TaxID=1740721 RepID=UPI0018DFCDF0|nr:hypothetical protein [Neobacillus cucumis]MBI0581177.1 hypothetical protein [Neobacillus cucumis]